MGADERLSRSTQRRRRCRDQEAERASRRSSGREVDRRDAPSLFGVVATRRRAGVVGVPPGCPPCPVIGSSSPVVACVMLENLPVWHATRRAWLRSIVTRVLSEEGYGMLGRCRSTHTRHPPWLVEVAQRRGDSPSSTRAAPSARHRRAARQARDALAVGARGAGPTPACSSGSRRRTTPRRPPRRPPHASSTTRATPRASRCTRRSSLPEDRSGTRRRTARAPSGEGGRRSTR